jgi:heme-degrading monooxygenase HmoA
MEDQHNSPTADGRVLSITKLISRGPRATLPLLIGTYRSMRQAARMPGFVESVVARASSGVGFGVTIWENEASRQSYVRSGVHGQAAVSARKLARAHVSCHVPWDRAELPHWSEWGRILATNPHIINTKFVGELTDEEKLAGPKHWGFPPPWHARRRG